MAGVNSSTTTTSPIPSTLGPSSETETNIFSISSLLTEEQSQIFDVLIRIVDISVIVGGVLEVVVTVFFLNHLFRKTPILSNEYFSISCLGFIVDLLAIVSYFTHVNLGNQMKVFIYWDNLMQFVQYLSLGPWHTVLVFDRFTALIFWSKQSKIWTGKRLVFFHVVILVYPFVVNAVAFTDPICIIDKNGDWCVAPQIRTKIITAASNAVHSIICLVLSLYTAVATSSTLNRGMSKSKKLERRLTLQAIVTSILFNFFNGFSIWVEICRPTRLDGPDQAWMYIVAICSTNLSFIVFHYSQIILLVVLSPTTRNAFLRFYKLGRFTNISNATSKSQFITRVSVVPSRVVG